MASESQQLRGPPTGKQRDRVSQVGCVRGPRFRGSSLASERTAERRSCRVGRLLGTEAPSPAEEGGTLMNTFPCADTPGATWVGLTSGCVQRGSPPSLTWDSGHRRLAAHLQEQMSVTLGRTVLHRQVSTAVSAQAPSLHHSDWPWPTSCFSHGRSGQPPRAAVSLVQGPPDSPSPGPAPGPSHFLPGLPTAVPGMPKPAHSAPSMPSPEPGELTPGGASIAHGDGGDARPHFPPLETHP